MTLQGGSDDEVVYIYSQEKDQKPKSISEGRHSSINHIHAPTREKSLHNTSHLNKEDIQIRFR